MKKRSRRRLPSPRGSMIWISVIGAWIVLAGSMNTSAASSPGETMRVMRYHSGTVSEAIAWQKELRSQFYTLLKLDDWRSQKSDRRRQSLPWIAFKAEVIAVTPFARYTQKELEIKSTPARRIRVLLTLPNESMTPRPAVICIHGHGGSRYIVYDPASIYKGFAQSLAERGYVTIAANVGQHEVYEAGRELMGERLWDLMRCADYLESLPEVDRIGDGSRRRARIGCAGLSLGGEMAMWLGAMDTRMAATVSAGFLTVMDQMEQNHCMCWKFDGLRERCDYADIYSLIAPRALQCQNGLKEGPTMFTVPLARQALQEIHLIYNDYDRSERLELDVHDGAHEIDLPALLTFFEKYLPIEP